jgi:hypothetical protein
MSWNTTNLAPECILKIQDRSPSNFFPFVDHFVRKTFIEVNLNTKLIICTYLARALSKSVFIALPKVFTISSMPEICQKCKGKLGRTQISIPALDIELGSNSRNQRVTYSPTLHRTKDPPIKLSYCQRDQNTELSKTLGTERYLTILSNKGGQYISMILRWFYFFSLS